MILTQQQHHAVHRNCMMLFCFLLPVFPRLSVWMVLLAFINWLLELDFAAKFRKLARPIPLLFLLFYAWYWIGMTYTDLTDVGLRIMETKLSLLVFPLLLLSKERDPRLERNSLLAFGVGVFLSSFYCLGMATYDFLAFGEMHFFYKDLGDFLHFHPTYFAMYMGFTVFLIVRQLLLRYQQLAMWQKALGISLLFYGVIFVFLLAARMQLLVLLALFSLGSLYWMYLKGRLWQGVLITLIGLILLGGISWSLPVTKKRIQGLVQGWKNPDDGNIRLKIWDAAAKGIAERPVLGHGTGDVQTVLDSYYAQMNLQEPLEKHQNAHNQYLQTALAIGLIGLILWLAYLFVPLWIALRKKQAYTYAWFILLFLLSCLTESMLETQRGIMFFGFMNALLLVPLLDKRS